MNIATVYWNNDPALHCIQWHFAYNIVDGFILLKYGQCLLRLLTINYSLHIINFPSEINRPTQVDVSNLQMHCLAHKYSNYTLLFSRCRLIRSPTKGSCALSSWQRGSGELTNKLCTCVHDVTLYYTSRQSVLITMPHSYL